MLNRLAGALETIRATCVTTTLRGKFREKLPSVTTPLFQALFMVKPNLRAPYPTPPRPPPPPPHYFQLYHKANKGTKTKQKTLAWCLLLDLMKPKRRQR